MGAFNSTIVTVSSKGWVVIPSLFRRKIGVKPGMKMMVTETEGKIILTPQAGDPVDELYGKLAGGESLTAALLAARVVATAVEFSAAIVTGDPEFKETESRAAVLWL